MSGDHVALYAAELEAFDGTDLETLRPLDELRSLAERVVASPWWAGPEVRVGPARRDARSSSACSVGDDPRGSESGMRRASVTIRLATAQQTVATVAHELAHALVGPCAGHDAAFRSAYLDVIAVITNLDPTDRRRGLHVDQLRSAFGAHGLSIAMRRWPAPPAASAGPIAL